MDEAAMPHARLTESGLEEILLGGVPVYDQLRISEKSGLPVETGQRIWKALGFPVPPEEEIAFTEQDLDALRDIRVLLDDELVDEELVLHLSRAVGQTMGRLAGWVSDVWMKRAAQALTPSGADGVGDEAILQAVEATQELLPRFERLLLQGWRRQLAASGLRVLTTTAASTADPAAGTATLAVGFVDIVSFTRLSRQMDGDTLAAFVERFEVAASETCAELGGRIVKTLGDEVLFTADDPVAAAEVALRLTERSALDEGFPRVRAGVAFGEVVRRLGDVFGTPVNLAARLTSVAHPGTVLVDVNLATAVAGPGVPAAASAEPGGRPAGSGEEPAGRYETAALRPRALQGLGRVRPWTLRRRTAG